MTVSAVSVRTIAAPKRVAVRKAAASRAQVSARAPPDAMRIFRRLLVNETSSRAGSAV